MGHVDYDLKYTECHVLLAYLNRVRDAVVRTVEGLTDEEVRAPGVPSGTNLLGLVQHLTGVERHWFRKVFLGEQPLVDKSMVVPPGVAGDDVVAAYRRACADSDEIVRARPDLSVRAAIPNPGGATRLATGHPRAHGRGDSSARRPRRHPAGADRRSHRPVTASRDD